MNFNLPEHLLKPLDSLAIDTSAVLLLRHAQRGQIASGDDGIEVDLTAFGYEQSYALGKRLTQRLKWAQYSPLLRARRTVEQSMKGAGIFDMPLEENNLLGSPGPFVVDCEKGKHLFTTLGTECLVKKMAAGHCFDGIRSARDGTQYFVDHFKKTLKPSSGLGLMISHDAIVIPLIAVWTGECFQNKWLEPLDGVLIVVNARNQLIIYRNNKIVEIE